jgi:acyl-coenzyme A thioesterase PaaI-like protein
MTPSQELTAGFAELLGMRLREPGHVSLILGPMHLNSIGRMLGPVGLAMIDYAMAGLMLDSLAPGEAAATVNITTNFVAGADTGEVHCRAAIDRRATNTAALSARVEHEDGRLLITALGTFAVRPAG